MKKTPRMKSKMMNKECNSWRHKCGCKNCGGVYFLGFIGAAVYYIQTSTSFGNGVVGILKALVWPAMLIYKLLGL